MIRCLKKLIIPLFCFSIFVTNIDAKVGDSYQLVGHDVVDRTLDAGNGTTDGAGYGGAYKITLQDTKDSNKKITAYCTDPYAPGAIGSNSVYTESTMSAQDKAAYSSIFNNTCNDESAQVAATKTYIAKYGSNHIGYDESTQKAYMGVYDGSTIYTGNGGNDRIKNLVEGANNAASSASSSSSSDKDYSWSQPSPDTIMIESENPDLNVSGSNCTSFPSGTKTIWKCTIEDVCPSDNTATDSVSIDSGGDPTPGGDGGEGDSACPPCEPRMYTLTSGADGTTVQRFVACVDSSGGSRNNGQSTGGTGVGETPGPGGDTGADEVIELSCNGFEEFEDECLPYSKELVSASDGTEICDESGTTVLFIDEYIEAQEYDEMFECVNDGKDLTGIDKSIVATESIFSKIPYAYDTKHQLCSAYCTENYDLELPGPTSNSNDPQVMVNSGTFFTIDEKIKGKTTATCFVEYHYKEFIFAIDEQRQKAAEEFNRYKKSEAYQQGWDTDSTCIDYAEDEEGNPTGECIEYSYSYDWNQDSYDTWTLFPSASAKETSSSYQPGKGGISGGSCGTGSSSTPPAECDNKARQEQEDNKYTAEQLGDAVDAAREKIKAAIDVWENTCLPEKWNLENINGEVFENVKRQVTIEFEYWDGYGVNYVPVVLAEKPTASLKEEGESDDFEADKPHQNGLCDTSNCYAQEDDTAKAVDTMTYSYKSEEIPTKYVFNNLYCNLYDETGVEYIEEENLAQGTSPATPESMCPSSNKGTIIEGFPVSYETPQGKYSYRYSYDNIGHYYDSYSGTDNRLVNVMGTWNSNIGADDYDNTCVYTVNNCKACNIECVTKNESMSGCNLNFYCSTGCKVACAGGGCILDFNNGFLITYRTISLNAPFPNEIANNSLSLEPFGLLAYASASHGNKSSTSESSTLYFSENNWNTEKGKLVKARITGDAENVYAGEPEYSIILNRQTIEAIKKANETMDGYSSKTGLTCTGNNGNNSTFSRCTSDFVRNVEYGFEINQAQEEYSGYDSEKFTGPALK